jgi:hypothetical protein
VTTADILNGEAPGHSNVEDNVAALPVGVSGEDEVDAVASLATNTTELAMSSLNYYGSWAEAMETLNHSVMPTSKVLLVVDAPTSNSKIATKMIDDLALLSKALSTVYSVQFTHGAKQSQQRRPAYMLVSVPLESTDDVPIAIPALAAKARRTECPRLHCLNRDCTLRPTEELNQLTAETPLCNLFATCEMNNSDMDGDAADHDMGEEDAGEEGGLASDSILEVPTKRFAVKLWPFAYGSEFYKNVIEVLHGAARPDAVIVATLSAHPGIQLAVHDLKLSCHTVLDRVRQHSASHGMTLLREVLFAQFYSQEKAKVLPSEKRLRSGDLSSVRVRAPEDQTPLLSDMPPDSATSAWRASNDVSPSSTDLKPQPLHGWQPSWTPRTE